MNLNRLYTPPPAAALAYLRRPPAERCPRCAWDAAQVLVVEAPEVAVRRLGVEATELAQIAARASPEHGDARASHLWTPPCQADAAETIEWLSARVEHAQRELQLARQDGDRLHGRLRQTEEARIAAHNRATNAEAMVALLADADPDRAIPSGVLEPRPRTPQQLKDRLVRFRLVAKEIIDGLDGTPFSWRLGWRLKQGVAPVGSRYFSRHGDHAVYVLEAQAVPVNPAPPSDRDERRRARRIVRTGGPRRRTGAPIVLAGAWAEAARIYRDRAINLAVALGMAQRDLRTWQEALNAVNDQRPLAGEELAAEVQALRERNEVLWMHSVDLEERLAATGQRLEAAEQALRIAREDPNGLPRHDRQDLDAHP